ncbi:PAS domain S-box-containing protein [Pontibacter akesuensis]|uniref:histidine kinase n=1 Tax=Pontibacter akesuensis TaxID=388950 RepID=A0A1I7KSR0_9BACT|nr:PAS domain S-box-containing protein [Pontibacter akesuensis]
MPPDTLRIFETLPDPYLILSPDLTILTASEGYLKNTRHSRAALQGKTLQDALPAGMPPDAQLQVHRSLEWVLAHKQPQQPLLLSHAARQPDAAAAESYWRLFNTPVLDEAGNVQYLVLKLADVTEAILTKQQLEHLSQQQEQYDAELNAARAEADLQRHKMHHILVEAPAMICVFEGPHHVFKFVNPPYQQLVGERSIIGKPIAEAMPELAGQPIFGLLDHVYNTGETYHAHEMKVQLDHENSGAIGHNYYNFTYQALRDIHNNIDSILVFAYEVTAQVEARQKVEQREQALQLSNEQLTAANEEIQAANEQLTEVQQALQELNKRLEKRVADRMRQLEMAKAEIELQRNRLQQLFMEAPAPIVILDGPELTYQLVNPAYQQIFPGRDLLGKPLLKALPELEGTPLLDILANVYNTGQTYQAQEFPLMLARHEGAPPEEIFWNFTYQARRNELGEVDGAMVFAHDVTEQVKSRQVVEQRADSLRLITDALPVLIGYLDKDEKYRFANKAYESWFNMDPKQLLGRPVREVVGEAAYQGVKTYIDRALAGERLDFESRMPYREDFVKHIRTSYVPDIQQGKVEGFFTLVNDVTEQKLVLQKIEKSEREAKALADKLLAANAELSRSNKAFQKLTKQQQQQVELVENSNDFISLASPSGRGVYLNQAGLELVGLTAAQVKQVKITDYFHEDDKAAAEASLLPALKENGRWTGERNLRHFQTGADIPVHYNSFSIKDPETGEILGLAAIAIDISERKKQETELQQLSDQLAATNMELSATNEQLTRTNIDLDNFIYTASHDLKAPIFNIEGLVRVLLNSLPAEALAGEGLESVPAMIEESIQRFKSTIEHLTEVTKLQKENNQGTELVDLEEVIGNIKLDLKPQLEAANATLHVDVADCPNIRFSKKNLRSVVYNLISNAIKYHAPDRALQIEISCRQETNYAVLAVKDNGLGIDLTNSRKLFTMFGRLHDHVEGSGVGLYMVKRIIENADGKINVESKLGEGSTFTVSLKN